MTKSHESTKARFADGGAKVEEWDSGEGGRKDAGMWNEGEGALTGLKSAF